MKKLIIDFVDERFNCQSFLLVRPKRGGYYSLNDKYHFYDTQCNYLGSYYLVSKSELFVTQVNNEISHLDKNCNRDIYYEILTKVYNLKDSAVLEKLIFSSVKPLIYND